MVPPPPIPSLPLNAHPTPISGSTAGSGSGSSTALRGVIAHSQAIYRRDLRALFEHAKDRFGDVKWGTNVAFFQSDDGNEGPTGRGGEDGGMEGGRQGTGFEVVDFAVGGLSSEAGIQQGSLKELEDDAVWAHKAMIYARASKSFKSRFFPSNSSASSGHPQTPTSRAPSTTPSTSGKFLHPNTLPSNSGPSNGRPGNPPRYTRSASVLSNRPRDAHGVTVLDDLGMKEMLSLGLEGMYDPDVFPRTGMREIIGDGSGEDVTKTDGNEDEEGGMEWLLMQGGEAGREEETGVGLGLGVGLGMGGVGKGKGREVDGARAEEIKTLMREKQSQVSKSRRPEPEDDLAHDAITVGNHQDLTYMWRSKLYADVLIQIPNPAASSSSRQSNQKGVKPPPSSFRQTPVIRRATSFSSVKQQSEGGARPGSSLSFNLDLDKDLGFEVDEETGLMTFSAHRFILCSRSPYFAQVLLNAGEFQPHMASAAFQSKAGGIGSIGQGREAGMPVIGLESPPFTPQAMHFILGYIYSGSLGKFSNKQLDMATALLIRKGAAYLEMEALEKEVEGRLIWEFAHGVAWDDRVDDSSPNGWGAKVRACRCRKCVKRIPRLLRFATSPDVSSKDLESLTKEYVIRGWSECLGKDVALLDERLRDEVLDAIVERINFRSVVSGIRGLLTARRRLEQEGKPGDEWYDDIEDFLDVIAERTVEVMTGNLGAVLSSKEMVDLVEKPVVDFETLEALCNLLVQGVGRVEYCRHAPVVHQVLVNKLLNKRDERTEQLVLPVGSRVRDVIDDATTGMVRVLRKRWMQIRQEGAFADLDPSSLEELAKSIGVSSDDLVQQLPKRRPAVSLNSSTASKQSGVEKRDPVLPRPRVPSLDSRTSVRVPPTLGPPATIIRPIPTSGVARSTSRNVSAPIQTVTSVSSSAARPVPRATIAPSASTSSLRGRTTVALAARRPVQSEANTARGAQPRLARVAGGNNSQAGPSEPRKDPLSSGHTPTRQRALSTPGSQRQKAIDVVLAPPLPTVEQKRVPNSKAGLILSSVRASTKTPEPRPASTLPNRGGPVHATSRQASIASLSEIRERTVSNQSQKTVTTKTPLLTPGNSPGRRKPSASTQPMMPASPKTTTRSPLAPREKTPVMPSVKPTASTLAKKVSTPAIGAKRTEDLKKVPAKSISSSSIRSLRTSPAPTKIATSASVTSTGPTTASLRSRFVSNSTTRSRLDSDSSGAGKNLGSGSRTTSGPFGAKTNSGIVTKQAVSSKQTLKQKELSETTDDAPTEIITPIAEKEDSMDRPAILAPEIRIPETLHEPEGLPKILEPSMAPLSTLAEDRLGIETEMDVNSTLPRSFGSQLDTEKKIVLGLPVPSETRRPSMQMLRTASASAALACSESTGRYHPASAFDPPPRTVAASTPAHILPQVHDGIPFVAPKYGSSLSVGIPCIVALTQGKVHKFKAMARYIGRLESTKVTGEWVGVEVEERFLGKTALTESQDRFICDGSFDGRRYFKLEQQAPSLRRASQANFGQTASLRGRLRVGGSTTPQDIYNRRGMRSASASPIPWPRLDEDNGHPSKTVALFLRPNEIVFVLEAGE